jgi:4-amino-4-deoxy-L-arabinose transferase-like glycosyltransferase
METTTLPKRPDQRDIVSPRPNFWQSRAAFLVTVAALVAVVIALYARERWLAVVMLILTDGLCVAGWVLSAWLLGRLILRPLRIDVRGALAFATAAALGLGALSLAALGLGLAGLLNFWTTTALLAVGPAAALPRFLAWAKTKPNIPVDGWLRQPLGGEWMLACAAPLLGVMIVGASIVPGLLWKPADPHPYDALEYHLQIPREWYEAHRIVPLHHNVFSYFPNGVEVHYLMAMHLRGGPWAAMYQCQYFSIAWVLLTAASVYGVTREMSGSRATGSAAAAIVVAMPWMVMLGSVAYTESALALYTALAIAWVLRALRNEVADRLKPMLIAGAMAGFACGVKYTAVPMVLLALVAAVIIVAIVTRPLLDWIKPLVAFVIVGVALFAPWLIRNVVWVGNPVFPLAMSTLGRGHFDEGQVERFRIAHAPPAKEQPMAARVGRAYAVIFGDWQYGYLCWPICAVAIALAWRARAAWLIAGYLVVVLVVWIGFTHLLGRFYVLAIPVAAMALGLVRGGRWAVVPCVFAGLMAITSIALLHQPLEHFAELARHGFFGLDDLSPMTAPGIAEAAAKTDTPVWLVGSAEGFLYPIPSARLHYRTVFDLPGHAPDMYRAWLGQGAGETTGLIVINPMEVERLSRTYYGVPGLPTDYAGARDEVQISGGRR